MLPEKVERSSAQKGLRNSILAQLLVDLDQDAVGVAEVETSNAPILAVMGLVDGRNTVLQKGLVREVDVRDGKYETDTILGFGGGRWRGRAEHLCHEVPVKEGEGVPVGIEIGIGTVFIPPRSGEPHLVTVEEKAGFEVGDKEPSMRQLHGVSFLVMIFMDSLSGACRAVCVRIQRTLLPLPDACRIACRTS